MGEFSLTHLLLLAVVFLIFFGPSKLPQLGQGLGKAIRGFKEGLNEIDAEAKDIGKDVMHTRLEKPADPSATAASAEAKKETDKV